MRVGRGWRARDENGMACALPCLRQGKPGAGERGDEARTPRSAVGGRRVTAKPLQLLRGRAPFER